MDYAYRLWSKAKADGTGCWTWRASLSRGYGAFWNGYKMTTAHRAAYELVNGRISDDLHVDHLCENPPCINPAHLEAVSLQENIRRSSRSNVSKTHCKRGHEFTAANTYTLPMRGKMKRPGRRCRACQAADARRYRASRFDDAPALG